MHECVRERRQPEWLKSAAGCLSEGFSGLRPSWCREVSKMENRKLDLPLLSLPQAALRVSLERECHMSS